MYGGVSGLGGCWVGFLTECVSSRRFLLASSSLLPANAPRVPSFLHVSLLSLLYSRTGKPWLLPDRIEIIQDTIIRPCFLVPLLRGIPALHHLTASDSV